MFNIRNIKQAGGTVRKGYQAGGDKLPTNASLMDLQGVDYSDPSNYPMIESISANNPAFTWHMYPGAIQNTGKRPTGKGVLAFQKDFLKWQDKLAADKNLQDVFKAKYDEDTLNKFLAHKLAGRNRGADAVYGQTTADAYEQFGPALYDLAITEMSDADLANALNQQDGNDIVADTQGNYTNYGSFTTVDPNTGAPTTTTDPNTPTTNDPNNQTVGTSPNAGHIRYITNGQWGNSYNPASHVQYQTYNPNASGNYYQYNNPALLGMNTGNSNYNVNLPNRGVGYNDSGIPVQSGVYVVPARGRGMRLGRGNNRMFREQALFRPRVHDSAVQDRINMRVNTGNRINAAKDILATNDYRARTSNRGLRRGERAAELESLARLSGLNLDNKQDLNAALQVLSESNRQQGENRKRRTSIEDLNRALADVATNSDIGVNINLERDRLNQALNAQATRDNTQANLNKAGRIYRNLGKNLRNKTDRIRQVLGQQPIQSGPLNQQTNYIIPQPRPQTPPNQFFANTPSFEKGGITRPKYQYSGRTNPNYFQSQFGSGYTNSSLQSPATKPFDPDYQLPNYRFDSDRAATDALDVDRHLYPEGDQFAQMALSKDYKDQVNDVMSGNIFRNYDEQRRPSKYQFHGSYANTPTDNVPNSYLTDINKRNTRALGFDQSGLTWGDKLQIMGNYTPALYNIAHSFIKPYPTMPAYNKYRYQVYHDMARQQTPKDYSDIYAASNKGMRDLRSNSPNAQVERANRLALYNSTMEALGKQKTANFATDRQLALAATQQLGQIGEHELAADEKARLERIAHEEARDNIRAKGVGQFGAATGKYGEAYNHALENRMKWELLSEIYEKYGLDSYNSVINGLNTGEFTAEDLILFKNTGSIEEVRRAKQARDAQQTTTGTKTTTETTDAASTNNGMTATRTTTSTGN